MADHEDADDVRGAEPRTDESAAAGGAATRKERPGAARGQLRRSREDRMLGGVAGGLACYLDIDPVLTRLGFVVLALAEGIGILLYIALWIIMPEEEPGAEPVRAQSHHGDTDAARLAIGGVLVLVGVVLLLDRSIGWLSEIIWPVLVIALGLALLVRGGRS